MASGVHSIDAYVFYFDVVGFVDDFLDSGAEALNRLRAFQRSARRAFSFSHGHSYVVTLYDNVWARLNAVEPGTPSLLLDFAGRTMAAARREGFNRFFGCITRGVHDFDPADRMLVAGETFEDLREQHLDLTSEPHIRAAAAEKWSRCTELPTNCVWVSAEVVDLSALPAHGQFCDGAFEPYGESFDLAQVHTPNGRVWPFSPSTFRAIRWKASAYGA